MKRWVLLRDYPSFLLLIHLRPSSEREAVELLIVPQIAKYRFHCGEALAVVDAPLRAADAHFHFVSVTFSTIPWKNATCLTLVFCGASRQRSLCVQGKQSRCAP